MNYWLHRISHLAEISYPLLEKGYLTIGFSDFSNPEMIQKALENDWAFFNNSFQNGWGNIPRVRYGLWNFLHFKKGDYIIVPSWGTFYVCEIIDERPLLISDVYSDDLKTWRKEKISLIGNLLQKENDKPYDLGFARKIKIIHKEIPREKFADAALTSRMKIRQTNAQINDLKLNIESSIENFKQNKPINLHSILHENIGQLILDTIKKELNPDKFEKVIKKYFESIGATEVYIPAKNEKDKDGDADIVAIFENLKLIIYTQAKFHQGTVNQWATSQISDYKQNKERLDDGYNKLAWVITTAVNFNKASQNKAKEENIQLINGLEFSKMLLNVGILNLKTFL